MEDVSNPIIIDQFYCDSQKPCQNQVLNVFVLNDISIYNTIDKLTCVVEKGKYDKMCVVLCGHYRHLQLR